MNIILLFVSVCTGAGRSIFSKKMSTDSVQSSKCFLNQLVMFLGAAGIIAVFYFRNLFNTTPITILWGIGFGIFAFLAQWCYMLALSKGPTSICTMIYSFGFLLPTMAGTLFFCSVTPGFVLRIKTNAIRPDTKKAITKKGPRFPLSGDF